MVPLGCKHESLKHVLSFRRQVFMFLNAPTLNVSFVAFTKESRTCCMRTLGKCAVLNAVL